LGEDIESLLFQEGTDTEKLKSLLLLPSIIFVSPAHELNSETIITTTFKHDTCIPKLALFLITQSFLFSPREKRK
jgi:hypothetical protein